jgi:hypothetical protein
MNNLGLSSCWILIVLVFVLITSAHHEISSTSKFINIQLSIMEVLYLNERRQYQEHMSHDDALSSVIELEHFYTLIKNNANATFSPSAMVDKAWHQHILHTEMYNMFSRQHFGVELLHHIPFWSGNVEEVEQISNTEGESSAEITYNMLVSIFGLNNVNATIWFTNED